MNNKTTIIFFSLIFIFIIGYELLWNGLTPIQKEMTKKEWTKFINR